MYYPGFTELKWKLWVRHYVPMALGLGSSGKLLTRRFWNGGFLNIDTNVLVHSWIPPGGTTEASKIACGIL